MINENRATEIVVFIGDTGTITIVQTMVHCLKNFCFIASNHKNLLAVDNASRIPQSGGNESGI